MTITEKEKALTVTDNLSVFHNEIDRIKASGYIETTGNYIDQNVCSNNSCDNCGEKPTQYKALQKGGSYRAYAFCLCGWFTEF